MKIAIIGAGWAGMAAAVEATQAGHQAVIFEASRAVGGRARAIPGALPDGTPIALDNGQHILIGAYTETLRLMRRVGIQAEAALQSLPMTLLFPDGGGLRFPAWPTPLDALAGMLTTRGWRVADKWSLLRAGSRWHRTGFKCGPDTSVAELCRDLSPRVLTELIEPLCVSALNTPVERASAQVFLRVLHDALFGVAGGSRLLLPRVDLGALFPESAARWLMQRGVPPHLGTRVEAVVPHGPQWRVNGQVFEHVIFATAASDAARILENSLATAPASVSQAIGQWNEITRALRFEAISTVYAWGLNASLPHPMLALRSHDASENPAAPASPAQFVFDRGQLGGPRGLLAFVVSASNGDRVALQAQVLGQARRQMGLSLQAVQTVVEKRATFACTPGLRRPPPLIAPGLTACGDYVAGPYPATLEGAVRSAVAVLAALAPTA